VSSTQSALVLIALVPRLLRTSAPAQAYVLSLLQLLHRWARPYVIDIQRASFEGPRLCRWQVDRESCNGV